MGYVKEIFKLKITVIYSNRLNNSDNMENLNIECPVCGQKMKDSICGNCGFLLLVFPKEVPQKVQNFESTRVRIMRQRFSSSSKPNGLSHSEDRSVISTRTNCSQIIGSLVIRNLFTESQIIMPIFEGKNIYGGKETDIKNFLYINPMDLGVDIPDIMFGIEYIGEALSLIPSAQFLLSHNRCKIKKIMILENDDYFFHSNILSFNAVLLKKP